jgi:type III secretion protein V
MKKRYALLSIDFAGYVQRYTDIFIGLILLFVLALLLLPIPTFVLDMAIAANFAFSLIVLATAVYLRSPTQLASFPALLLLTTLFRLAISIASTKMILLHAHAGEMIQAFGALVVGGSVAVGLVVFILLSAVQIIVVAKGADRVAEVAARFTLDGIPGRQMSIDADLRAGLISATEASTKREKLEQETHLMGSLDGAMKFVKGDAIATVVVAMVNIIGGIACGILIKKMSFGDSVQLYTILTIGDGLVSQLPSLIICIAAGIIITRVSGDKHGGHLGADIYSQLVSNPKAILMAAFASFLIAIIPGFPHLQFGAAGMVLLMMGVALRRQATIIANSQRASMPEMARDGASYTPRFLDDVEQGTAAPLRLRLGETAFQAINPSSLNQELGQMRRHLMNGMGMPFPGLSLQIDRTLPQAQYALDIEDHTTAQGSLWPGQYLALGPPAQLAAVTDNARPHPGLSPGGSPGCWIDPGTSGAAQQAGLLLVTADGAICAHLFELFRQYGQRLFGIQEARYLLDTLSILFPALVTELERGTSAAALTPVLQSLLSDRISIRNLRGILEAVVRIPAAERTTSRMLAEARKRIGAQIVAVHLDPRTGKLPAYVLDAAWEAVLKEALRFGPTGEPELALHIRDLEDLQQSLAAALPAEDKRGVLLTSAELRPHMAERLRYLGVQRAVLALEELHESGAQAEHIGTVERLEVEHAA